MRRIGSRAGIVAWLLALWALPACLSGGSLIQADEISVYAGEEPGEPVSLPSVDQAKIAQALNHFLQRLDTRSDVTYTDAQVDALGAGPYIEATLERPKTVDAPAGKLKTQRLLVIWVESAPAAVIQVVDDPLWRVYQTTDASARETLQRVLDEALGSSQ